VTRSLVLLAILVMGVVGAGAARGEPLVLIADPAILAALEASGLGLGERLGEARAASCEALARGPRYRALAAAVAADVAARGRAEPRAGVGVARHSHRLFDVRWLRAPWARFELVGVVNRIDRQPQVAGGCGDTRFVYRLAYTRPEAASRLPMTVTVDYRPVEDCAEAARRWRPPAGLTGDAVAGWLRSAEGALAPALLDPARLRLVQVNLQAVRWPSAVRPDMAAHAEYLLRAFHPEGERLVSARLENMPDVARLRRDRTLRADLLAWLGDPENLTRVNDGTFRLPDRFLAERALSISPRGLARRANRPFLQLFSARDLAGLTMDGSRRATPAALLRRLDDATCVGCHQARAVAGFHLLGVDAPGADAANALHLPASPHVTAELDRRRALTASLARGERGDFSRPMSERAPGERGGYGAHCGLGDPGFTSWTCAEGLVCDPYDAPLDDGSVGVCLPATPRPGDPCEVGRIRPAADARRDRVAAVARRPCDGEAVCNTNRVGFPGGMCTGDCAELGTDGVCGKIAVLRGFNDCLARRAPFARCLAENVTPAGLRACDEEHPCRDDYLCARTDGDRGACIPPYFLFQMRVDGHP
jgi:hypothetical protein